MEVLLVGRAGRRGSCSRVGKVPRFVLLLHLTHGDIAGERNDEDQITTGLTTCHFLWHT